MRRFLPRSLRSFAVVAAICLTAAGCGDDTADPSPDGSTTTAPDTTTTPPGSTTTAPSTTSVATTTAPTTTTPPTTTIGPPTEPIPDAELPGEAFDIAPQAGRTIAVIGVRFDDVLNVRRAPGTVNEIVAALEPTANDAVAAGRARMLTESIWFEVTTTDGLFGWLGSSFTAQLGPTGDTTAQVISALGYTPEEASISDLGLLVGETIDTDPDIPTSIVMTVEADETGDLAEVTFDVVGLGDDAVRGVRIHVFGQPLPSGDGFSLKTVEATDLCDPVRGPTEPLGVCA